MIDVALLVLRVPVGLLVAAHGAQVKPKEISSVGFCMGGRTSFLANSVVPLRAAVSFYGGGIAPGLLDRASKVQAPSLLIWGGLDKHITPAHRKAVTEALSAQQKIYVNVEFSMPTMDSSVTNVHRMSRARRGRRGR